MLPSRAERTLAPDVVRIRYSFEDNWAGEPSIFFKVVLSDEVASQEDKLGETADRVASTIRKEVQVDEEELGVYFFYDFRSLSEQDDLNEPAWA